MGIAGYLASLNFEFNNQALQTVGEVVEIRENVSHKGSHTYTPVVSFETSEQQKITFQPSMSSSSLGLEVGDWVNVAYLPSDPNKAKIDQWSFVWSMPITFMGLGGVFFLIGLLVAYLDRPKKQKSRKRRKG